MLTCSSLNHSQNTTTEQGLTPIAAFLPAALSLSNVRASTSEPEVVEGQRRPPQASRGPAPRKAEGRSEPKNRAQSSKRKRRGGWPARKCISRNVYKRTLVEARVVQQAGFPMNWFITQRYPEGARNDAEAKRRLGLSVDRIGQTLERRGQPYVALKVFEKPAGGLLHVHALISVLPENRDVIERWADRVDGTRPRKSGEDATGVDRHARPAVASDVEYILKEHHFAGPFERKGAFWEKSEAITGTRVCWTTTARSIIKRAERPAERPAPAPRLAVVAGAQQLSLFQDDTRETRPVARLRDFGGGLVPPAVAREIRFLSNRHGIGITSLARAAHISQPTLSNALDGRFPLSAWAARRLRERLLDAAPQWMALAALAA